MKLILDNKGIEIIDGNNRFYVWDIRQMYGNISVIYVQSRVFS